MRFKALTVVAAMLLVSACATEPEDTGEATQTGAQTTAAPAPTAQAPTVDQDAIAPGSVRDFIVNVGDRIFFDFDRSDIRADAIETLEKQAAWLRRYPSATITVEGHCDERGTREYNLALGERRANSHKDYLVSLGIDPARIDTISYGKERPAVLGQGEAVWQQNRRGVVVLDNVPAS